MNKRLLSYGIIILYVAYLVLDIIHYANYRYAENYPDYLFEGAFESHILSYIKWLLAVICLVSMVYLLNEKKDSIYFIWASNLLIFLIFIFKGQISEVTIGSQPYEFWLLEIAAGLSVLVVISTFVKDGVSFTWLGLSTVVSLILYFFLVSPVENVIMISG